MVLLYIGKGSGNMKLHFKTNDYLLTWNLLFAPSFSETVHKFKQRLYKMHKEHYMIIEKDKKEMLEDMKNFIPDDDTVYNYVFETNLFNNLKETAEKHRLELLKMWDSNKKEITTNLKEIIKFPILNDYNIVVLHPIMDTVLFHKGSTSIGWGYRKDLKNPILTLTNIMKYIVLNEIGNFDKKYKDIIDVVMELAIEDELYTRLTGESTFVKGDISLTYLKRQIYPYFLMYLGSSVEDYTDYMRRDGITFDIEKYPIEKDLAKLNLIEFVEYCIKNQYKILHINQLEIV